MPVQRCATADFHRRLAVERLDHAPISRSGLATRSIGRLHQRGVADQRAVESGPPAGRSSDAWTCRNCPGRARGAAASGHAADAVDAHSLRAGLFDPHAHRAHRLHRRQTILAFQEAADFGTPSAMPPSMSERCEMDLSPGTRTCRRRREPARQCSATSCAFTIKSGTTSAKACLRALSIRSFCACVPTVMRR